MKEREAVKFKIANYLKRQIERVGGEWQKLPDRTDPEGITVVCVFPSRFMVFVKVEPSGRLNREAQKTYDKFDRCGALQYVVESKKTVDWFIQTVLDYGENVPTRFGDPDKLNPECLNQ